MKGSFLKLLSKGKYDSALVEDEEEMGGWRVGGGTLKNEPVLVSWG